MRATLRYAMVRMSGCILLMLGCLLTGISCSNLGGANQGRQAPSPDDLLQRANNAYERGEMTAARDGYATLLKQDPNHIEALFRVGVIDYRRGQFKKSRTNFLKVLSIRPNHSKATYNLGVIYAAEGALKNTEKAAFFFDRYLFLAPNAPQKEKIMRWMALQVAGKRREEMPVGTDDGLANEGSSAVEGPGVAGSSDLKQWLQQEAEQVGP
jgi:tetratricopeptide (TPR) repeat protein